MISLWQPFASLIFTTPPIKTFETRSTRYPSKLQGKRIAIHATAKFTPHDQISPELDALCRYTFGPTYFDTLPRGVILGTVRLGGCIETNAFNVDTIDADNQICGDWTPGRFAWKLPEPHNFPVPIPAKGGQGWKKVDWL